MKSSDPFCNILIAGYFGYANAGDDAILAGLTEEIRLAGIPHRVTVLSGDEEIRLDKKVVKRVAWRDLEAIERAVDSSDLVILGGGGLLQDYEALESGSLPIGCHFCMESLLSVAKMAELRGVPVVIRGVGIGPFFTKIGRGVAAEVLRRALNVQTRSSASADLARHILPDAPSISVGPDLANIAIQSNGNHSLQVEPRSTCPHVFRLGVALRFWPFEPHPGVWLPAVAVAVERFLEEESAELLALPFQRVKWQEFNDDAVARWLSDRVPGRGNRVVNSNNYLDLLNEIGGCDLILGMRLHSLIFAVANGIPTVAIGYDPKIIDFMREHGLSEFVLPLTGIEPVAIVELLNKAKSSVHRFRAAAKLVEDQVAEYLPKAKAFWNGLLQTGLEDSSIHGSSNRDSIGSSWKMQGRTIQPNGVDDLARQHRVGDHALATPREVKSTELPEGPRRPARLDGVENLSPAQLTAEFQTNELIATIGSYTSARGIVIFPPMIDWGYMFQRPQQLARAFARAGYLSFYCTHNQSHDLISGIQELEPRLFLTRFDSHSFKIVPNPILYIGTPWLKHQVCSYFDPFVIYDCLDEISVSGASKADHESLLLDADLVLAASAPLLDQIVEQRPDALLVRNGVDNRLIEVLRARDRRHMTEPPDWPDAIRGESLTIGYVGALANWVDYDLLRAASEVLSQCEFLLVGVDYDGSLERSGVLSRVNVHWLGERAYEDLSAVYGMLDVGLIPFKVNKITMASSPIKLYEYLAAGIPVVASDLPECKGIPGVNVASTHKDFISTLKTELYSSEDEKLVRARQDYASANTWNIRVRAILGRLPDWLDLNHSQLTDRGLLVQALSRLGDTRSQLEYAKETRKTLSESMAKLESKTEKLEEQVSMLKSSLEEQQADLAESALALDDARSTASRLNRDLQEEKRASGTLRDEKLAEQLLKDIAVADLQKLRSTWAVQWLNRYWAWLSTFAPVGSRRRAVYSCIKSRLIRNSRPRRALPADNLSLRGLARDVSQLSWGSGSGSHANSSDLIAAFESFGARSMARPGLGTLCIFSPTQMIAHEGQRSTQLAVAFAASGYDVIHISFRWHAEGVWPQDSLEEGILKVPLDQIEEIWEQICQSFGDRERICLVEFPHPSLFGLIAQAEGSGWLTVYDIVDDWEGFHAVGQAPWFDREYENQLVAGSDVVTAVSEKLASKHASNRHGPIGLVPNGFDPELTPADVPHPVSKGSITIGYFGYMSGAWFDWELIRELAIARPGWRIHLIGYGGDSELAAAKLPNNVSYYGRQPRSMLAPIAANWDVGIIPFRKGSVAEAADPIKAYEYLGLGLPVVASGVVAPSGAGAWFAQADSAVGFALEVEKVAAKREADRALMIDFARENTWKSRVDVLLGHLTGTSPQVARKHSLFDLET